MVSFREVFSFTQHELWEKHLGRLKLGHKLSVFDAWAFVVNQRGRESTAKMQAT
jgi:hypothetical protein